MDFLELTDAEEREVEKSLILCALDVLRGYSLNSSTGYKELCEMTITTLHKLNTKYRDITKKLEENKGGHIVTPKCNVHHAITSAFWCWLCGEDYDYITVHGDAILGFAQAIGAATAINNVLSATSEIEHGDYLYFNEDGVDYLMGEIKKKQKQH